MKSRISFFFWGGGEDGNMTVRIGNASMLKCILHCLYIYIYVYIAFRSMSAVTSKTPQTMNCQCLTGLLVA